MSLDYEAAPKDIPFSYDLKDVNEPAYMQRSRGIRILPYHSPEDNPYFSKEYTLLLNYAEDWQAQYDMSRDKSKPIRTRILSHNNFSVALEMLGRKDLIAGFYDSISEISYIKEQNEYGQRIDKTLLSYYTAHEVGHHLTRGYLRGSGSVNYSEILFEGMADKFAYDYMNSIYFPYLNPEAKNEILNAFAESGIEQNTKEGLEISPSEVIVYDANTDKYCALARIAERRIVEYLELFMGPIGFTHLMKTATAPDILNAKFTITNYLGEEIWDLLTAGPDRMSPEEVLAEFEKMIADNYYAKRNGPSK